MMHDYQDARGSWEKYTIGFLRARGLRDPIEIQRISSAVDGWFAVHPPQSARDPFDYADAVIDCMRLRPSVPIEGPISYLLQCLSPPGR